MSPPAALQPIIAGIAPTSDPGTTAKEVTLLRYVYMILYQKIVNIPRNALTFSDIKYNIKNPVRINNKERINAVMGVVFPDGNGLLQVLSIRASYFLS